jgi:hypothetical protein
MSVSKPAAKQFGRPTTFTGGKLDWLKCVAFDPRLKPYPYDFKVAFQIAQHVNERTGHAIVSDEAIAEKTGGGSVRNVWNARHRLRDTGWLTWRRTRTASVYSLNYDKVNGVLDMITVSSEARREKRRKKRATAKPGDMNHSSDLDAPDMNHSSDQDMKHSADIHLRGTPKTLRRVSRRRKIQKEKMGERAGGFERGQKGRPERISHAAARRIA